MGVQFEAASWTIDIIPPWSAKDVGQCVEITQPEGTGALHISAARKQAGGVADPDLHGVAADALPTDTPVESVSLGDFRGVAGEYTDWNGNAYWKKWWLSSGALLLHVTYTCGRGDEDIEADDVERILSGLGRR
ncbi:MAG: hypothetical protein DME32_17705 [Verrucomicrobia bacterium]|nr:MAG: hypothetical protein DME32_17705 [Verrucomicrobiota bacterium]